MKNTIRFVIIFALLLQAFPVVGDYAKLRGYINDYADISSSEEGMLNVMLNDEKNSPIEIAVVNSSRQRGLQLKNE